MKRFPPNPDHVPNYLIRPLIQSFVDTEANMKDAGQGKSKNATMEDFSGMCGVSSRVLRRIKNEDGYCWFDTADRITTALQMNEIWQKEEWAPHYGPLPVALYELEREGGVKIGDIWRIEKTDPRVQAGDYKVLSFDSESAVVQMVGTEKVRSLRISTRQFVVKQELEEVAA